jgi:hypothetical protein
MLLCARRGSTSVQERVHVMRKVTAGQMVRTGKSIPSAMGPCSGRPGTGREGLTTRGVPFTKMASAPRALGAAILVKVGGSGPRGSNASQAARFEGHHQLVTRKGART